MRFLSPARGALAACALACLGANGCVQTPTVQLHHADIQGASLTGAVIDVVIEIRNPNSFDIKLRDVTAETTFANRYRLPTIHIHPDQWVPAGQATLVHVPTVLPWLMIPGILAETVFSPVVIYDVRGSADVTATRTFGIEEDNYPINLRGQLPRDVMVRMGPATVSF
jgi:hypothetical protein